MPIQFDASRWSSVRENYDRWWRHELKRPLINIFGSGYDPGRKRPAPDFVQWVSQYDVAYPAEKIVDAWDYDISQVRFFGDAFPQHWVNFGPGVGAAFLGAQLQPTEHSTWFYPVKEQEINEITFSYDPENKWLQRIIGLNRAASERWQGMVQIGMTDIGGTADILSTFRPSEKLLMDTCLAPDEIKRCLAEIHTQWWRFFKEIDAVIKPPNPGYSAWAPIFSEQSYYMLQSDFCYMIGPDMFDDLIKPELAESCKKLEHAFYHLDGPGEIAHLDSLLSIKELKGVQWIPGAGQPALKHWPEVFNKIRDAGKLIQVFGSMREFDDLIETLGWQEGIIGIIDGVDRTQEAAASDFVKKYCKEQGP